MAPPVLVEDFRPLAAAILTDAFRDLGGTARQAAEARQFLESPAARFWMEVAGHDPDHLARLDLAAVKQRFFKTPAVVAGDHSTLMR